MGILKQSKQYIKAILKKGGFIRTFPPGKFINVAGDFRIGLYPSITVSEKAIVDIGKNVELRRFCNVIVEENAELIIEEGVFFNNYCSINCIEKIKIGNNTIIGEGVKIYDHNHKYTLQPHFEVSKDKYNSTPVSIGSNCWIGSNVVILKGVTIGDNVIVGANCLIYKSVPANSMVRSKSELLIDTIKERNG